MDEPSGEKTGSVSILEEEVKRLGSPPLASIKNSCEPPSRLKVTASVLPSGAQLGALFDPLKLARTRRLPEKTS